MHVCEVPVGYPGGIIDARLPRTALEDQGRAWLRQAAHEARAAVSGLRVEQVLDVAPVVPTLVAESRGAALTVLGSRGLGGFTGLLLGSTSQHLLCHAPCPVAVVRTHEDG